MAEYKLTSATAFASPMIALKTGQALTSRSNGLFPLGSEAAFFTRLGKGSFHP